VRDLRYAAHDVDAKLQAFGMEVVGERFETIAIRRGRKPIRSRQKSTVVVERQDGVCDVVRMSARSGFRFFAM
jgi:hypothetical protein